MFKVVVIVLALTSKSEGTLSEQVSQIFDKSGQTITQSPIANGQDNDFDDFAPYNSSRHDEFDWKLIKVWTS